MVCKAQQRGELSTVADALIQEAGGSKSARRIFQGKIRGVRSTVTATAHSLGEVFVEGLSEDEMESDADRCDDFSEVVVPFMNENLAVIAKDKQGNESVCLQLAFELHCKMISITHCISGLSNSAGSHFLTRRLHW